MATVVDWLNLQFVRRMGLQSRMVRTDHGRVHALVGQGQGELGTLVMIHGLSASASSYRNTIEFLLPHVNRLILPDMLGHGLSESPSLGMNGQRVARSMVQAIDQLSSDPVVVFGNSMGGYLTLRIAQSRPQLVRGLFVSSPAGAPMDPEQALAFSERFRVADLRDGLRLVEMGFASPPRARLIYALGARKQFSSESVTQLVNSLTARDMFAPDDFKDLAMPITFAWGREERVLLEQHRLFFDTYLPAHAKRIQPEGWGHAPAGEVPEDLAKHLVAFMGSLRA
ncbi:MAG: pimeloyl-ACP methyl ester carboxylesterase [Cognaticolwellia sp.]|jgi:pimeloyl-ACP methyl ester carboxylesterase